jgi:hypothetical protein
MINRDKECKDVIIKPLEIYRIWAALFILLVKKRDYKIFIVIMEDIKKVLELK